MQVILDKRVASTGDYLAVTRVGGERRYYVSDMLLCAMGVEADLLAGKPVEVAAEDLAPSPANF